MSGVVTVSNFTQGWVDFYKPFNLPDDAFALLQNAHMFRGAVLKKPGQDFICRLSLPLSASGIVTLDGSGNGSFNVLSFFNSPQTASLSTSSLVISDGTNDYADTSPASGVLSSSGTATGTINYATGAVTISGGEPNADVSISCVAFPGHPVMGAALFIAKDSWGSTNDVQLIFDTTYSYRFSGGIGDGIATTNSYYYSSNNVCSWSGADWQLFRSCNYAGAVFLTNGVPGMQFKSISSVTLGSSTTITFSSDHGLVVNDYIWINEVNGASQLNGLTGMVTSVNSATEVVVNINSSSFSSYTSGGIAQYLTSNKAISGADGLRYFNGTSYVNYAPPISAYVQGGEPVRYICGATKMVSFKGRLIITGLYTTSSVGDISFSGGAIFYSAIGNPFYTDLFPPGTVSSNPGAFYQYPVGRYGGFIELESSEDVINCALWKSVLIVEYESFRIYLSPTNSPAVPFSYETITRNFGGINPTSSVSFDDGLVSVSLASSESQRGFTMCTTQSCVRIDSQIPNEAFAITLENHGAQRLFAFRDAQAELIYFMFCNANNLNVFPNQTLVWNYRERCWSTWVESYTCAFTLLLTSGITWADMTEPWYAYNDPWASYAGETSAPHICAGNQVGFIVSRGLTSTSTDATTLYVSAVSGGTLTIYNHNLYVGAVLSPSGFNGVTLDAEPFVEPVSVIEINDNNTVTISKSLGGTYIGDGTMAVLSNFNIVTKSFSLGWDNARCFGVGNLRFLSGMTQSATSEITVNAFANENYQFPSNAATSSYEPIFTPSVYTSPDELDGLNEDQNASSQAWRKVNIASANASTIAFEFTLSPEQMLVKENSQVPFSLYAFSLESLTGGGPLA